MTGTLKRRSIMSPTSIEGKNANEWCEQALWEITGSTRKHWSVSIRPSE
jgi:hypothetical protein